LFTTTRGVAPSGIDYVDLGRARPGAHLVDDREYVRRQLLNAVKIFAVFRH
jgi:hypothetical protein